MKIVRRLSKSVKLPIGRYLIVTKETKRGVYAKTIGGKKEDWLAEDLSNYVEIPSSVCKISREELEKLKCAWIIYLSLIQVKNKERKAVAAQKPKIIKFWAPNCGSIYVVANKIATRIINGNPCVYVDIDTKIYDTKHR